jgi:hypothetical protein
MKQEKTILNQPISEFATSNEFEAMCERNGFDSLEKILVLPVSKMLNKPEFNHRMLKELYQILQEYNLTGKLKES